MQRDGGLERAASAPRHAGSVPGGGALPASDFAAECFCDLQGRGGTSKRENARELEGAGKRENARELEGAGKRENARELEGAGKRENSSKRVDAIAQPLARAVPYDKRPDDGHGGKVVPMRLQKFLARAGVASRRASENLMTAGRVTVNGAVVSKLGAKVDPLVDVVEVDGAVVTLDDSPVTLMLNKPAGVVTTMKAQSSAPIVANLVPLDKYPGLFPIGRLDADTTGILLFSTDGNLGNALLHPSHHVPKTYLARLERNPDDEALDLLRAGIELEDGMTAPAEVEVASRRAKRVRITIHEGRYHQIKRMFEAIGCPVVALHREKFGPLSLGSLAPGEWRLLTPDELALLCAMR